MRGARVVQRASRFLNGMRLFCRSQLITQQTGDEMSISDKTKEWNETVVAKNMAKAPERAVEFRTTSNIEMERCFTPGIRLPRL